MNKEQGIIPRGLLAGFVGGTALAAWFLVLDFLGGNPFQTPDILARAFFGPGAGGGVPLGLVPLFTLMHYLVFLVAGIATAWLLDRLPSVPPLIFGTVVGFLLFDLLFYGAVLAAGPEVLSQLGWPRVFLGNLLAGGGMGVTLHFMGERRGLTLGQTLKQHPALVEGAQAGIFGGAAVAVWFFALDTFRGQPFLTPGALGSAVLSGARTMEEVSVASGPVLGYTILHFSVFVGLGVALAYLLDLARKFPHLIIVMALVFVISEAFFMGFLVLAAEFLLEAMTWWAIAVGNLLAALLMGGFLASRHPELMGVLDGSALGWGEEGEEAG